MADGDIPEDVYWTGGKEPNFVNAEGKSMGGKFFDEWKDRREDFPMWAKSGPRAKGAVTRRTRAEDPPVAQTTTWEEEGFLEIARTRRRLFEAYVEVGFTEEQALELCVK
jgi:hypothetical protein